MNKVELRIGIDLFDARELSGPLAQQSVIFGKVRGNLRDKLVCS